MKTWDGRGKRPGRGKLQCMEVTCIKLVLLCLQSGITPIPCIPVLRGYNSITTLNITATVQKQV